MNEGNPDIGVSGVAGGIAGAFLDAHIGAGEDPDPVFPPQRLGEGGAVADVEPEVEAARRDAKALVVAEQAPRDGEALAIERAVILDMLFVAPGGG